MLPKRRSAALRPMTDTVDVDCGDSNEEAELCMEEIDLEGLNVNAAGAGHSTIPLPVSSLEFDLPVPPSPLRATPLHRGSGFRSTRKLEQDFPP